jgi:hypothetical protein
MKLKEGLLQLGGFVIMAAIIVLLLIAAHFGHDFRSPPQSGPHPHCYRCPF